jgi:hypothetical protein
MKARTQDEKFMITLYEQAKDSGDLSTVFSRFEIGDKIAMHPRGVNAICKLLLQANFIKKDSEEGIYITEQGTALVLDLFENDRN